MAESRRQWVQTVEDAISRRSGAQIDVFAAGKRTQRRELRVGLAPANAAVRRITSDQERQAWHAAQLWRVNKMPPPMTVETMIERMNGTRRRSGREVWQNPDAVGDARATGYFGALRVTLFGRRPWAAL